MDQNLQTSKAVCISFIEFFLSWGHTRVVLCTSKCRLNIIYTEALLHQRRHVVAGYVARSHAALAPIVTGLWGKVNHRLPAGGWLSAVVVEGNAAILQLPRVPEKVVDVAVGTLPGLDVRGVHQLISEFSGIRWNGLVDSVPKFGNPGLVGMRHGVLRQRLAALVKQ